MASCNSSNTTTLKVTESEPQEVQEDPFKSLQQQSQSLRPTPAGSPFGSSYDIRRSLSPLLDFSNRQGGGERRYFCNIDCTFCRPMTDNNRLSPLRSPVISPSSTCNRSIGFLFLKINNLIPLVH